MSNAAASIKSTFSFSGHETFPFRNSWLKKGIDAISRDGAFFSTERAMVELGVGKNMVQSIRHWCLAAGLISEDPSQKSGRGHLVPTVLGERIFAENGLDPYLEDPGTLWLIHWRISSNEALATTWFWVFSHWNTVEFTKDKLISDVQTRLEDHGVRKISENTLKRDVDCFVRTYVNSRQTKSAVLEDTLDCPLVDLRLVSELGDGKTYLFQRGPQVSLPDEVFAFALLEFWEALRPPNNTLAFEKIAYAPGSPGRLFKLDEDSIAARLERLEVLTSQEFGYDETAGLRQIYKRTPRAVNPVEMLAAYYGRYSNVTPVTN